MIKDISLDDLITAGVVDEYGCHKKCGEYYANCTCGT